MEQKVLIVVDMQNGFMTKPNYIALNKKIENLIALHNYNKIYFTKFKNTKNSLYETKVNWTELCDSQSQGFSMKLPNDAIIFEKYGYGLSVNQIEELKKLNVSQIDICGLQTDACVYAIAFQLFDCGIFPNVLINYAETSPSRKDAAKEMLIHQFGSVDETK